MIVTVEFGILMITKRSSMSLAQIRMTTERLLANLSFRSRQMVLMTEK